MASPRDLRIPADVAAVIGAGRAAELIAGPWPTDFRCPQCGRRGRLDSGQPATAGLDVHPDGAARLWFAHLTCTPGGVVRKQHRLRDPENGNATGIAAVVPTLTAGNWPLILVELAVAAIDQQGDETIDLTITTGITQGMHPAGDIFHPPPAAPGWHVDLPRGNRPGGVHNPNGGILLQPLPDLPDGWIEAARDHRGRCGVYLISRAGLTDYLDGDQPDQLLAAILDAGQSGRLAGVTADVTP
jgi:hypothetical protein